MILNRVLIKILLIAAVVTTTGCASYPNYYIKDSTITSQQQTAAPVGGVMPYATVPYNSSPVFFIPPVYGWGTGGYWGGGWGGGWNRGWGCW